jgi:hypothetical protein
MKVFFSGYFQAKKLTMDEYAMNHPAGRIGKRLILKVCTCELAGLW